jgi:hypothetical protein
VSLTSMEICASLTSEETGPEEQAAQGPWAPEGRRCRCGSEQVKLTGQRCVQVVSVRELPQVLRFNVRRIVEKNFQQV